MRSSQTRDEWFIQKFGWLKRSAIACAIGIVTGTPLMMTQVEILTILGVLILFVGLAWFLVVLCLIPILHWKDRYRGERSTLWAFFLVFETSGWSKLFYWFMHVLPDRRQSGVYEDET